MLSALRNIYQVYCGPAIFFVIQLVGIGFTCTIFQSTRLRFRCHDRCHIHKIELTNSSVRKNIYIPRGDSFSIIKSRRKRRTIRNTVKIDTALNVIRNRASDRNSIYKRRMLANSRAKIG